MLTSKMLIVLSVSFLLLLNFVSTEDQSIQEKLNAGKTPHELLNEGVSKDSLYGKIYQGGHIFYLFKKDSGMVMGPEYLHYPYDTLKKIIIWSCRGRLVGAKERKIGSGRRNTIKIRDAECTLYDAEQKEWMASAAEVCLEYKGAGYMDWFLPSRDELQQAWLNLAKTDLVQFNKKMIWSSTEKDEDFAWIQYFNQGPRDFDLGGHSYYKKYFKYNVRPVRVFK